MMTNRPVCTLVVLALSLCHAAYPQSDRVKALQAGMQQTFDKLQHDFSKDPENVSVRDLSNGAFFLLATNGDAYRAESLFHRVLSLQKMDRSAEDYGTLPWKFDNADVNDANAIEFGTQAWGPILLGYRDRLSPDLLHDIKPHAEAALVALQRHNPPVSYTNIYLMNTVNTLLLADVAGDTTQYNRGLDQLHQEVAYIQTNGIHEFDSPTYYATDLNSLLMGYRFARREEVRAQFKALLNYFWEDIAARYNPAVPGHLAGAHSRDYDFLRGLGGLEDYLYLDKVLDTKPFQAVDLEKVYLLANALAENGYHPDERALRSTHLRERIVLERWDEDPGRLSYTYLTPDFSIGVANGDYGPQDKLFNFEFASNDLNEPEITIVPDTLDAPYGLEKQTDKSGHAKPHHIPLHPSVVQDRGTILLLLDLDPSREKNASSMATNILFPVKAEEILLDGKSVDVSSPSSRAASLNNVLALRQGNACFAARFFHVDAADGITPKFELRAEADGLGKGAARLVVYHSSGSQLPATKHLHVGLLLRSTSCTSSEGLKTFSADLRHAHIDDHSNDELWEVKVAIADSSLEIAENISKHKTAYARANGRPFVAEGFSVNGERYTLSDTLR